MLKPERERVEPKDMGTRVLNVAPEMRLPLIKQAATAIVNDLDRTEWIHFAHALDGALDGDPEAEDIFLEFSSRRTEGRVDEAKDQRTWDTRGKGRAGYGFIMQLLEKQGTEEAKAAHAAIRQAQRRLCSTGSTTMTMIRLRRNCRSSFRIVSSKARSGRHANGWSRTAGSR